MNAERHGRTADREAYRARHYTRSFTTTSGNIEVAMPKLKGARFVTACKCQAVPRGKHSDLSLGKMIYPSLGKHFSLPTVSSFPYVSAA